MKRLFERILCALIAPVLVFSLISCGDMKTGDENSSAFTGNGGESGIDDSMEQPDKIKSFDFSFTFNTFGSSSYDSKTGKLIKTVSASNPDDYITTMFLTEAQTERINRALSELDPFSYPDTYDPYNDPDSDQKIMSAPSRTLVLRVVSEGKQKTINCPDIVFSAPECGYDRKARDFLSFCEELQDMITSTSEWKALPDYEVLYD